MIPTIVIIGRRNVGKSALFNRLIEQQKAIVSEIGGTTRDRTEGICLWRGQEIRIVDTGGLDVGDENTIDREIKKQARFAIKEANLILFLVDARVGPQPSERALATELRKAKAPTLLIANKAETEKWRERGRDPEWKRLGFGIPETISAITGQGVGDLLDTAFTSLPSLAKKPRGSTEESSTKARTPIDIKVAIIGKPNVGKSSLLNKLLGEERVIVSPVPHTTREPQDTLLAYRMADSTYQVLLVDTAGIRKKAKMSGGIEHMGIAKTFMAIRHSDVVIFVLDATEPLDAQDKQLAHMIEETGVGVVIALNKHDLLPSRDTKAGDLLMRQIHFGLPGLTFAPVVFISAKSGHGAHKLLPVALEVQKNRNQEIPPEDLEALLPKLILRHRPARSSAGTKHPIIRRIEQTGTKPPAFLIAIGPRQSIHETYLRYLENRLREFFDFEGTPIKVWVKQEKN